MIHFISRCLVKLKACKLYYLLLTDSSDVLLGISDAEFALGQYHFNGGRHLEAMGWFEKATASGAGGCTQAKYQLGVMYYDGLGVKENSVSLDDHVLISH